MANVKPSEIEHFNQQASFWWDENGPFKSLHHINPVRTDYVKQFVDLNDKSVLDVGCGGGVFSEAMAANNANVTAIDLAGDSLEVAKLHLYESHFKIDYQNQSVEDFASQHESSFDVIVCMEMLEHVPCPQSVVDACAKILKPGGWLFLSTINRSPKAMVLGIFVAEYVMNIIPKGTHHYEQFIKPSELATTIEKAGLTVKDICGIKYNPISTQARLEQHDVSINYLIAAQKP
ncbi:3-demethylubiquinol 3-O-methyltransferase @ 2-polyprenyl-6-hydroxyphenyl methylase [hydrothermal vent metagenome]|uniref:3-demethylubiquinol 3-O-methyltransferase @ 2-polyprenyl-6-hydroxyphenyl methylase n=1 Tax=hydrothermal vent metagenome TaxID=652676 RepID=A0A3B0VL93_9ZZZZ